MPRKTSALEEAAAAAAAAYRETPADKRDRIAELEERARVFGDSAKQSAQARVLERKWQRFILVHGKTYGFSEKKGPTVKLVEHFTTYCHCTRDTVSAIGREGLGDSFELQIRRGAGGPIPCARIACVVDVCVCARIACWSLEPAIGVVGVGEITVYG